MYEECDWHDICRLRNLSNVIKINYNDKVNQKSIHLMKNNEKLRISVTNIKYNVVIIQFIEFIYGILL